MKLKQISIFLENAPGRLYEATKALGDAGINLRALSLADTGDFGVLRLLVSDVTAARAIMMERHFPARVDDVIAAEIEDKPGSLAKVLKPLLDERVNLTYMYAFAGLSSDKAIMVFRFGDNDRASEILRRSGVRLLDAKALGMLESVG